MKKMVYSTLWHYITVADHGHELVYTLHHRKTPINATTANVCIKHTEYRAILEHVVDCDQCSTLRGIVTMYIDQIKQAEDR